MECIATAHIHLYCMFAHGLVIAPVTASVRTCMLESFLTTFCGWGAERAHQVYRCNHVVHVPV